MCCLARYLPYFDLIKGFPLPVTHGLLLGPVKSFWLHQFQPYKTEEERPAEVMPHSKRKVVQRRKIKPPHDRDRPQRDITKYLRSFTMEELRPTPCSWSTTA